MEEKSIVKRDHLLDSASKINHLIRNETDADRFIESVCSVIFETFGCFHVWLALFDTSGQAVIKVAECGLNEYFLPLDDLFKQGMMPACAGKALQQPGVVITKGPLYAFTNCPLLNHCRGRDTMTVRLEFNEKIYGLLSTATPKALFEDQEKLFLFQKPAGDIAFGLYNLTVRKKRLRAQEELSESEKFNASLVNNSPIPIIVINQDTLVRYVNPTFEIFTGFSAEEVVGIKDPYPWRRKENLKRPYQDLKKAMNKGLSKREECFQKKNGDQFWVVITSIPIKTDGAFQYYLENWVDISERKRLEEELIRKRERIRPVFAYAGDAIVLLDLENHIISFDGDIKKLKAISEIL